MNPDSPIDPRSALESSLTALLLGELPHEQAAALHQKLAQDAELAKLYERLKHTINLVRETVASPAAQTADQPTPLKLSDHRRQKLLEQFKTVAPKQFAPPRRRAMSWLVPVGIAAVFVVMLAAMLLPALSKAKVKAMRPSYGTWYKSESAASAPSAAPVPEPSSEYGRLSADTRRGVRSQEVQRRLARMQPAAATHAEVKSAGAVIVLPPNSELADTTIMPPAADGVQLGATVTASTRGYYDDASGRSGGARGDVAFDGVRGRAQGGAATVEGRQTEIAANDDFFRAAPADSSELAKVPLLAEGADTTVGFLAGSSAGKSDLNVAAAGTTTLNYQWGYDAGAQPGLAHSDGDKPPILGDLPLAGRFFRSASDTAASSVQANAGSFTAGQAKDELTTFGFVPALTEEKVKSVEWDESKLAENQAGGPVNRGAGVYGLGIVGYKNVPPASTDLAAGLPVQNSTGERYALSGKPPQPSVAANRVSRATRSPIVLPSTPSDASSGRKAGSDNGVQLFALANQPGAAPVTLDDTRKQEGKVRQAQKKVDDLRAKLNISDALASGDGTSPLMSADTLRKLESLRIESKAELVRQQTLADRLKLLGEAQGPEVDGVIRGLDAKVLALSNSLDNLEQEVAKAAADDAEMAAQTRPYFEAKRTLEELKRSRQLLEKQVTTKANQTSQADVAPPKPAASAPIPQPEVPTAENNYSTFSLNVSDVSFKLAGASLEKGVMPDPATVRSEEFINAFDYRDPEPPAGVPVAFAWERAQYPFAQNRDLLRFSVKTAALGRQPGRPLNLVLLLDNSGSMERADRVRIIREALRALAGQLQPQDKFSVVTFSRTPRLFADGAPGSEAEAVALAVTEITPEGGTNLEEAMNLAYQTALRHYLANGVNRVVLLTDGAANLGNVDPEALKQKVEANRKQGIALDCFGIGWEGYNDDLLEVLVRNGDGRYGFVNTPEDAATEFAGQLAGALRVAASDVKVQVEFNPARVTAYRQIGYAKHQLTKEQFRDNTVDAAEIGAAESGNALYVVEVNPRGDGPLATVRVRYKVPGTSDYHEHEWAVPYIGNAVALEQASPAMRLAATASAFSEWLVSSPYAGEVTPDRLLGYFSGVPEVYGADARPKKLEWMIRQTKSIAGK